MKGSTAGRRSLRAGFARRTRRSTSTSGIVVTRTVAFTVRRVLSTEQRPNGVELTQAATSPVEADGQRVDRAPEHRCRLFVGQLLPQHQPQGLPIAGTEVRDGVAHAVGVGAPARFVTGASTLRREEPRQAQPASRGASVTPDDTAGNAVEPDPLPGRFG